MLRSRAWPLDEILKPTGDGILPSPSGGGARFAWLLNWPGLLLRKRECCGGRSASFQFACRDRISRPLAACAPALRDAVEGRLGRPLSEDPEFWRAALKAALQWSAEEFGFPDHRRGDDPLGADRLGHGSSAAGHLHAAGLRI